MRFHSKKHNKNHHSSATSGYPDSATDPIGSYEQPFQGEFIITGPLSAQTASFVNAISDLVVDNITINNSIPNLTVENITVNNDITSPNAILEGDGSALTNVDAATINGSNSSDFEFIVNKDQANGYVGLDGSSNITGINDISLSSINGYLVDTFERTSNKGSANGYVPLDGSSEIPTTYIQNIEPSQLSEGGPQWFTNGYLQLPLSSSGLQIGGGFIAALTSAKFLWLQSPVTDSTGTDAPKIILVANDNALDNQNIAFHYANTHNFASLTAFNDDTDAEVDLTDSYVTIGDYDNSGVELSIWGKGFLLSSGTEPNHLVNKFYVDEKHKDLYGYTIIVDDSPVINLTAGVPVDLTNDADQIFNAFSPITGNIWNSTSNQFEWSELDAADMVEVRLDLTLTGFTTSDFTLVIDLVNDDGTGTTENINVYHNYFNITHTTMPIAINPHVTFHINGILATAGSFSKLRITSYGSGGNVNIQKFYCTIMKR